MDVLRILLTIDNHILCEYYTTASKGHNEMLWALAYTSQRYRTMPHNRSGLSSTESPSAQAMGRRGGWVQRLGVVHRPASHCLGWDSRTAMG